MDLKQQRKARIAQAKHRNSGASHKTELENALLLLAWEAADLSEGQLSKLLGMDRIALRQMRLDMLVRAMQVAESMK